MPHPFSSFIGFYPTRDLKATHAFYVGVLGLTLWKDQGSCHIYAVTGGGFIGFCLRPEVNIPETVALTFVTQDVDGVYQRLIAAGVECESPPRQNDGYGIYHFYARGPGGERVEVQRFGTDP